MLQRQRRPRGLRLTLIGAVVCLCWSCAGHQPATPGEVALVDGLLDRGVDLDELLAPPGAADVAAARAAWLARQTDAVDARVEAAYVLPDAWVMLIVSHGMPSGRHVGGVLAPAAAVDGTGTYPVLLGLHGLGPEMRLELPDPSSGAEPSDADPPAGVEPIRVISVWPSFSGHTVVFRDEVWASDGDPWDFCDGASDDALRFLDAVLELVPGADPGRVAAFGGSRGGTVALLASLRDSRIRRVISVAAPTDFFAESLLRHPNAHVLYANGFVRRLLDGTGTLAEARALMVRCSPRYFAADLPPVQLHHGTADRNVPVDQLRVLARQLAADGHTGFEVHEYEGGDHQLSDEADVLRARVLAWTAPVFAPE